MHIVCSMYTCVCISSSLASMSKVVYGCMDVWLYRCMDVWTFGCMDSCLFLYRCGCSWVCVGIVICATGIMKCVQYCVCIIYMRLHVDVCMWCVNVRVCVYACIYLCNCCCKYGVYVYVYVYICVSHPHAIFIHRFSSIRICIYTSMCMYICIISLCTQISVGRVCLCVCVSTHVYTHMYVCLSFAATVILTSRVFWHGYSGRVLYF